VNTNHLFIERLDCLKPAATRQMTRGNAALDDMQFCCAPLPHLDNASTSDDWIWELARAQAGTKARHMKHPLIAF
jgi:hypothetical protein